MLNNRSRKKIINVAIIIGNKKKVNENYNVEFQNGKEIFFLLQ